LFVSAGSMKSDSIVVMPGNFVWKLAGTSSRKKKPLSAGVVVHGEGNAASALLSSRSSASSAK